MSQSHAHEGHRRSYTPHSTESQKATRELAAFDAGEEDGGGAPSPSVPLGNRRKNSRVLEKIAFDPAFRNVNSSNSRVRLNDSHSMPASRTSWISSQEDMHSMLHKSSENTGANNSTHDFQEQPRSSSTLSWSATSGHSQIQSFSHLMSSNSSSHGPTVLPGLQARGDAEQQGLEPLTEEGMDPASFDLVIPANGLDMPHSLETQSELMFSVKHLAIIFEDPTLLQRFSNYLHAWRPQSVPLLVYYLEALKALRAIEYANALSANLALIEGLEFTSNHATSIVGQALQDKAKEAFATLANNDLPAFITQTYIQTVSVTIKRRIANTLPPQLREQSEGLAEVFCLTDPSRLDNPIVFASEEFHRTTQYGMHHVLGRNCRFLQGPKTNPFSVARIREKLEAGKEHCETFLNYRRDGSPFMNLLMVAPLLDSRGVVRYHIGAQVDVSGLVKSCAGLDSLSRLMDRENSKSCQKAQKIQEPAAGEKNPTEAFRELAEMFNLSELKTVRESGGVLHRTQQEDAKSVEKVHNWHKPRLLISDDGTVERRLSDPTLQSVDIQGSGRLGGVYENYLLVRPFPNLRILFASPNLRVPGMLQSPFMDRIGGSSMVRDTITQAFAEGNGITAKVRWTTRVDRHGRGRPRWIHCTPLLGLNGAVGVWMVVLVDEEPDAISWASRKDNVPIISSKPQEDDQMSLASFAEAHRVLDGRE